MFYAGNGTQLVSFENKARRDSFINNHPSFGIEKATRNEARDYPQFEKVKCYPESLFDDRNCLVAVVFFTLGTNEYNSMEYF